MVIKIALDFDKPTSVTVSDVTVTMQGTAPLDHQTFDAAQKYGRRICCA